MGTDIKRNKHDNTETKLQVQWNQTKYVVLEYMKHVKGRKRLFSGRKRLAIAEGIHILQDIGV